MSKQIRVLVVDDHPFFRTGVVVWLGKQTEITCCGEADSVLSARKAVTDLQPDVILLDLQLEDGDGLDLVAEFAENYPTMRVLVLSQRDEDVFAHRAIRAGARGYVMKSEAARTVLTAIETVCRGEIYLSRTMAARALQNLFPDPASTHPQLSRLSDRELQVFQLVGSGSSTREVSVILKISPKTVETHRENLKQKLHLEDGEALVRAATNWVRNGEFRV